MLRPPSGKIVIVGGGVAGLAAAFELTKPGRYPGESVVVHQMGWRLGGKCASGRDEHERIIEHGLHVWFGFYENAFRLLQEVYEELPQTADGEKRDWRSAIKEQRFTPIGPPGNKLIPLKWPEREGFPGDGVEPSVLEGIHGLVRLLRAAHEALVNKITPEKPVLVPATVPTGALKLDEEQIELRSALDLGTDWINLIQNGADSRSELENLANYFKHLAGERKSYKENPDDVLLGQLYDLTGAFIAGVIIDIIIAGATLTDLDQRDFREWLVLRGADHGSAYRSPIVKALYDTMFQYVEGRTSEPSYGAGTAATFVLRLLGTYKGSAVWKPAGSLGEVLIAPLYQVLRARGVQFEFFHKLTGIELSEDKTAVARLRFARQVAVPPDGYVPTVTRDHATYWPSTPIWKDVEKGPELRDRGIDLESRWCDQQTPNELTLEQGEHFADVVLAIPLGAFKPFSRRQGPCDELIRASAKFRALAENIPLVPSFSVQLWCAKTLDELKWAWPSPTMVSGSPALQIWADMTQIIAQEGWQGAKPRSLHYFCNVFDSSPSPVNAGKVRQVGKLALKWLEEQAVKLWSGAGGPRFDWNVLFAPPDQEKETRLEAQVMNANVDPSACCVSSAAGTTRWRLKPEESGFAHLVLAGAWTDTGLNTECVEAAVMSGMQASRALCGAPHRVFGEDFLRFTRDLAFEGPQRFLAGFFGLGID
jgi:uncharacterized protein with NAD-binding domain and iron-sulfur cluster